MIGDGTGEAGGPGDAGGTGKAGGPGEREAHGAGLSVGRELLCELSAAVGGGGDADLRRCVERAARSAEEGELEARAVEEALLQTYLFVGFPAALTAMSAWRERTGEPPADGAPDPVAAVGRARERGEEVCRVVYGPLYERLRQNVRRLHPDLDRWMIREGYGKVLGRPGLELAGRELCIVALLAAAGRGPQLHSHLRGALRAGAREADVGVALAIGLGRVADPGLREELEAVWERVRRSAAREARREGAG
ncbi:MAG TPA: carboxymuconolactone decarboxylase family protein [Gemmatimonadota bacterium]|nr:carboxymuconolactone decarboxylase family protein [Gemmatimonadota bacterium]